MIQKKIRKLITKCLDFDFIWKRLQDKLVDDKYVSQLERRIAQIEGGNLGCIADFNCKSAVSDKAKVYSPYHLTECTVGEYTYIAQDSFISYTEIGKFCSIGPNFLCGWGVHPIDGISTHPMFYSAEKQNGITLSDKNKIQERKLIKIGNDVFIGMNVTILDGITIGDGAVIGAGAVVSKDIPPYAVAIGCPIRVVKYRFDERQREALLKVKWWEWDLSGLKEVEKYFWEVDAFLQRQDDHARVAEVQNHTDKNL